MADGKIIAPHLQQPRANSGKISVVWPDNHSLARHFEATLAKDVDEADAYRRVRADISNSMAEGNVSHDDTIVTKRGKDFLRRDIGRPIAIDGCQPA